MFCSRQEWKRSAVLDGFGEDAIAIIYDEQVVVSGAGQSDKAAGLV